MARRKIQDEPDDSSDQIELPAHLRTVPAATVDGIPNPRHYQIRVARLNYIAEHGLMSGGSIPFNLDSAVKSILREAELAGVHERQVTDLRTDDQKVADVLDRLERSGATLLEATDAELDAIEKMMDRVDTISIEVHREMMERSIEAAKRESERGKAFRRTLERVRRLRIRARQDFHMDWIPKVQGVLSPRAAADLYGDAFRAMHLLRYMLYVCRSGDGATQNQLAADVLQMSKHHVEMSWGYWLREKGLVPSNGQLVPYKWDGLALILPPRHGKTLMGCAMAALQLAKNPNIKVIHGHYSEDMAKLNLGFVSQMFDRGNPMGRRNFALYGVEKNTREVNNSETLTLFRSKPSRQPSMRCGGVLSGINGSDADFVWLDDENDQKVVLEEPVRNKIRIRVDGTWLTRRQSASSWVLTTATIWHRDDSVSVRIAKAREGRERVLVIVRGVGRKYYDKHARERFDDTFPLWPERFGREWLQGMKDRLGSLYRPMYLCDPVGDDVRIVRRLAVYDPTDEVHQRFVTEARYILSIDPSATANRHSDDTGWVYAGIGPVVRKSVNDSDHESVSERTELRIIEAGEMKIEGVQIIDFIRQFCQNHPVDEVIVETAASFAIIPQIIERDFGIKVVSYNVQGRNFVGGKVGRLRMVAPMLEATPHSDGKVRACVAFPGVSILGGKALKLDPEYEWLQRQILDAGFVKADHAMDSITQMIRYLSPELSDGAIELSGRVSDAIRKVEAQNIERMRAMMDEANDKREQKMDPNTEEAIWMCNRSW